MLCYSIGHSNQSLGHFLHLLQLHSIDVVIDVRSIPYSGYVRQFNREVLQLYLEQQGVEYRWLGGLLGEDTFREQPDLEGVMAGERMQAGLARVAELVAAGRLVVLMCVEKDPIICHRFIVLTYALKQRGIDVRHILVDGAVATTARLEERLAGKMGADYYQVSLFDQAPSGSDLYRRCFHSLRSPRAG